MVEELSETVSAMEVRRRKPFKICNSARTKTLGIVAESLRELKEIASLKFGLVAANCWVCLNSDGTEIDNEEYFSFLEDQTKLVIICDGEEWKDDHLGGKEKENNTKSRKGKTSTRAEGRGTEVARDVNKLLKVKTIKRNALETNFRSDMQELENESSDDDMPLIERLRQCCGSPLVNKRKAPEQAKKSTPQRDNMQAVNNLIKCHSLKGQRMAHASVSNSREAVLCASTYKSLFIVPKHSCPRRKEAIETSSSKVAEWLCTNNVSSTLDEKDSDSDEGTIDVGSESAGENRVDKEPATVAMKRDNGQDSDEDGAAEEEKEDSSLNEGQDSESSGCRMVEVDCKERPPTKRILRFPEKDVELKTCQVKIYKLPVSLDNGRPRVVGELRSLVNRMSQSENDFAPTDEKEDDENYKITSRYLTPIKNLPEGQIVWLRERNTVTKTTAEQDGQEEHINASLEEKRNQEVRPVDSTNVEEKGNSLDPEFVAETSFQETSRQKEEEEDHGPGVQRSNGFRAIKEIVEIDVDFQERTVNVRNRNRQQGNRDVLEFRFEGNETVIQQSERSMSNDVELESVTQDSDEKQCERNKERRKENKRWEECGDDLVESSRRESGNDGAVASNVMIDGNGDKEQVIEDFTEKEGEKQARLKGNDIQLIDLIHRERANGKMEGSKDVLNRVVDGDVERGFVVPNTIEEFDEMSAENVELHSQNAVEETFNVARGNSADEADNFSYETAIKSYEECNEVTSGSEVRKKKVELEVVTQNPAEKTLNFEQKKSGDRGCGDMSVEDVDTSVRTETAEEWTKLGSENERGKKLMGNDDALVKNFDGDGVDGGNVVSNKTLEDEVVTINSAANTGERQNGTKTKEEAPQKNVTQDLGDSALISSNTAEENVEEELSARKKYKKNEGKLAMNNDQLVTIVHQECVGDLVNNSENILLEETVQPELLTKKTNEKKTMHNKKRKERNEYEVVKNAAIKHVDDHASVAGETEEKDVESTLVIQDFIANTQPRKGKRKRLTSNEKDPVENSVEQCVSDGNLVLKKTEKISGELDVTQESGEEQSEDVLAPVNGLVIAIDETAAFTKSTTKDVRQHRNEKKSKRKKKKTENERIDEDGDKFEKDSYQGSCDDGAIASKEVAEETMAHEQVTQDFTKTKVDRSEKKARLQGDNDALRNEVRRESVSDEVKVTKNILNAGVADENHVGLEIFTQNRSGETSKRKKRLERKEDLLVKGDIRADSSENVADFKKITKEIVTHDITKKTTIDDNLTLKGKATREHRSSSINVSKSHKSSTVDWDNFCADEREKKDEKRKDKKRKLSHGNDGEGNYFDHIEKKKKRKTEEKRRSKEKKGESDTERIPALLNLEKAESLDDSGYSQNSLTVVKPSHPCATEEGNSVTESTGPKRKKDKASVEAAADQGSGKKKSKMPFSLLDLALDDTAGSNHPSTLSNLKTPVSEGRSFNQIRRHFRDKPKGFVRVVQNRKRSTPIRTPITTRKPRTEPRRKFNREKVKGLVTSNVSFDQALEDYPWDT